MTAVHTPRYFGIDGCPDGWFCVGVDAEAGWTITVIAADAIAKHVVSARAVFIDIPIGLVDSGPTERTCDLEARRMLGRPRGSSVFPVPARASLSARDYREALSLNRRQTARGISKQAWMIAPKIKAVDDALQNDASLRGVLHESHPEICFWALNGARAMRYNKKTVAGRQERMALLKQLFPPTDALFDEAAKRYRRRQVAMDDIVDAMVLAVSASLGDSHYRTIPNSPPRDATGLAMQMVFSAPPLRKI